MAAASDLLVDRHFALMSFDGNVGGRLDHLEPLRFWSLVVVLIIWAFGRLEEVDHSHLGSGAVAVEDRDGVVSRDVSLPYDQGGSDDGDEVGRPHVVGRCRSGLEGNKRISTYSAPILLIHIS